ncbi:MAG: cupin domain-containing protein [Candidatus Poribacteria bacterium]|nr:cupin domain-containing protein [Candidatus Poribacteria bacterium]
MKRLAFEGFYAWSVFSDARQMDFNGHVWVREGGNVLIDPVPMSGADFAQLTGLGGAALIVITNRDHERDAAPFKAKLGAEIVCHEADAALLEHAPDRTVGHNEEIVPGLRTVHLEHGKSPGEMALYWQELGVMLVGDIVSGAPVGKLSLLPDEKLDDPAKAAQELRQLFFHHWDALLVGDGHSLLSGAKEALYACLEARTDFYFNRINFDEVEWHDGRSHGKYGADEKQIGDLIGARHIGHDFVRLQPGKHLCPLHWHLRQEELFIVWEGSATMVTPRGEWVVRRGDFIAFPVGPTGAHKFYNHSDEPVVLLAMGANEDSEVCYYGDSNKVGVYGRHRFGLFRAKDAVGYFEGEDV